ncbi:MAG TPA: type II secretion system protein GspM [Rhizomicrobium sp.]|nr:type II secretion system protein GspM [Rhizomicrobium sp.]
MKQLPEGAKGQALALAIAALGAIVLYLLIVSPVLAFYGEGEDLLDQRLAMAGRYEALARELPALRAADKKWRDQEGGELLLEGSSDALASAALQATMKSLVEDAGTKLASSEVLQPTSDGNFRRVGIRVVFSGDLKLVTAVLRGVETSRPILSVGNFSLHAGGGPAGAEDTDDESASAGDSGALSVTLDVYGFRAA